MLTPDQARKLARIHNRATLYEIEMVHRQTGERRLLCYTRKTKRGLFDYVYTTADRAAALGDFCLGDTWRMGAPGFLCAIGEWNFRFSGRTQRACPPFGSGELGDGGDSKRHAVSLGCR